MAAVAELERGRNAYAQRAWHAAYTALIAANAETPLGVDDLELLVTAAGMLGRDDEYLSLGERAHHAHLEAGQSLSAARSAFWVGLFSAMRGDFARASGWLGRAQRLVERAGTDCAERGYLLVAVMKEQEESGEYAAAYDIALEAAEIGERFGDADLVALALHGQGRARALEGSLEEGLRLLDETMVAVSSGELSPIVTGIVYCSVIEGCHQVYELRRAREWTAALSRWCGEQPEMVTFTGRCLVHRAEIMQTDGAWPAALEEAQRAGARFAQVLDEVALGESWYRQGEIRRLRGENTAAEEAYREASRCGWEPQPGLALLRLASGDLEAAVAGIRRVVGETSDPLKRAGLLPAYVEVMLTAGAVEDALAAAHELETIGAGHQSAMLVALVAQARGAVALARGDAWAALVSLRHACEVWQTLGAPYEVARVRVLVGLACRELGDADAATLELDGAQQAFRKLGARTDLARLQAFVLPVEPSAGGLTARELPGARPRRHREDEQGDRRRPRPQREDRGPAREQHLRQARRVVPVGGDGVRLRARARLAATQKCPQPSVWNLGGSVEVIRPVPPYRHA